MAYVADKEIHQLNAAAALTGAELVPVALTGQEATMTTTQNIANLATGNQNLQQVTDNGNTTDNDIIIADGTSSDKGLYITPIGASIPILTMKASSLTGAQIQLSDGADIYRNTLQVENLTGNNTQILQDASGKIALINGGLVLPTMIKLDRDAIVAPIAGLAIYQTDNTPGLRVYNGTNWMRYTETID